MQQFVSALIDDLTELLDRSQIEPRLHRHAVQRSFSVVPRLRKDPRLDASQPHFIFPLRQSGGQQILHSLRPSVMLPVD